MKNEPSVIPRWVTIRIAQLNRAKKLTMGHFPGMDGLINSFEASRFIDHWGRQGKVFYCEPYMPQVEAVAEATWLAELLCCHWRFAESVWNPPQSIRVEFFQSESDQLAAKVPVLVKALRAVLKHQQLAAGNLSNLSITHRIAEEALEKIGDIS